MLDEYKKAKVVAMYKCLEDEVNLDELINIAQNMVIKYIVLVQVKIVLE